MPIEMALWRLEGNKGVPVSSTSIDSERLLEEVLQNDISILGLDRLLVIGRQVPTRFGKFVDLLALGPQGDLYVIELKRDRTPREVVAQALELRVLGKNPRLRGPGQQVGRVLTRYQLRGSTEDSVRRSSGRTECESPPRHRCL